MAEQGNLPVNEQHIKHVLEALQHVAIALGVLAEAQNELQEAARKLTCNEKHD